MKIDLSIIIVSFNTKKLTTECVGSIIKSKPKVSYELIVVDNGSTDGSAAALRQLRLKLIENKDNVGFAKANNQGIKIAKGKYIMLLNSDTKVERDSIDGLYNFAVSHIDAGVVGPRLINADGSVQGSVFRLPTISGAVRQYFLGQKELLDKYAPKGDEPVVVEAIVMAAFLITPLAIQKVGLLDERYFMYFEDLDYCRRVNKSGLKIYYLPQTEIIHYHGGSGGKTDYLVASSKIYHGVVNHYFFNFIIWFGQKIQNLK